jgi:hypothetical protein
VFYAVLHGIYGYKKNATFENATEHSGKERVFEMGREDEEKIYSESLCHLILS